MRINIEKYASLRYMTTPSPFNFSLVVHNSLLFQKRRLKKRETILKTFSYFLCTLTLKYCVISSFQTRGNL